MRRGLLLILLASCGTAAPRRVPRRQPVVVQPASDPAQEAPEPTEPPPTSEPADPLLAMFIPVNGRAPRILEVAVTAREDQRLDVHGKARDAVDVAELGVRVRDSALFSDIELHSGESVDDDTAMLFHFSMRCTGGRSCDAAEVQRVWRNAIAQASQPVERPSAPFPVPSTLKLLGILSTASKPSIMLVDEKGLGWIMHLGDTRGGEKLIRVASDHVVFRNVSDGTTRRLSLY